MRSGPNAAPASSPGLQLRPLLCALRRRSHDLPALPLIVRCIESDGIASRTFAEHYPPRATAEYHSRRNPSRNTLSSLIHSLVSFDALEISSKCTYETYQPRSFTYFLVTSFPRFFHLLLRCNLSAYLYKVIQWYVEYAIKLHYN